MANSKSAKKRIRQNEKRRARNRKQRSRLKSAIKKCMNTTDADEATAAYRETAALLDRFASRNIIHRNKAARKKAQLARHVKEQGGTP